MGHCGKCATIIDSYLEFATGWLTGTVHCTDSENHLHFRHHHNSGWLWLALSCHTITLKAPPLILYVVAVALLVLLQLFIPTHWAIGSISFLTLNYLHTHTVMSFIEVILFDLETIFNCMLMNNN